jgi:hypothetical protein
MPSTTKLPFYKLLNLQLRQRRNLELDIIIERPILYRKARFKHISRGFTDLLFQSFLLGRLQLG